MESQQDCAPCLVLSYFPFPGPSDLLLGPVKNLHRHPLFCFASGLHSLFNHLRGPLQRDLAYISESHHSSLPQPGRFPLSKGPVRSPGVSHHIQFTDSSMSNIMDFKLKRKTNQKTSVKQTKNPSPAD